MYKKIEGVITGSFPFGDNDRIIKIITKDGIYDVIAKGANKLKSPFFSNTSKFIYGIFNIFYKEKVMSKLVDVEVIDNFKIIKKDIIKISYVTYITELIIQVIKNCNYKEKIYDLYLSSVNKINLGLDAEIICDIISLKALNYLGIMPSIDACTFCGSKNDIITISSYVGGLVCKKCYKDEKIVNIKTINIIRKLYYIEIDKIGKIEISSEVKKDLSLFINDYYDRYSGIYLKSRILLDNIK